MVKSSLNKKFDKIKEREEAKSFSKKTRSRIISKFINNRLAVLGLVIFSVILLKKKSHEITTTFSGRLI